MQTLFQHVLDTNKNAFESTPNLKQFKHIGGSDYWSLSIWLRVGPAWTWEISVFLPFLPQIFILLRMILIRGEKQEKRI